MLHSESNDGVTSEVDSGRPQLMDWLKSRNRSAGLPKVELKRIL